MAEYKVVINDVKSGKSYQKLVPDEAFHGKKIRDKVDGKVLGLHGYELEITGGSDNAGVPMRADVEGMGRRRILIGKSVGVRDAPKGIRYRKTVSGNTISNRTVQVNVKVIKHGAKSIEESLGLKKEEKLLDKPSTLLESVDGKKSLGGKEEKASKEEHHKKEEHKVEHKPEHKVEHKTEPHAEAKHKEAK